jgi:hypothetical protein
MMESPRAVLFFGKFVGRPEDARRGIEYEPFQKELPVEAG